MKNKMLKVLANSSGRDYWEGKIKESQASKLTIEEFCKQKGIAISVYYHW